MTSDRDGCETLIECTLAPMCFRCPHVSIHVRTANEYDGLTHTATHVIFIECDHEAVCHDRILRFQPDISTLVDEFNEREDEKGEE